MAADFLDFAGVCTGPGPCDTTPTGTGKNWVTKAGGLPPYIRAVIHAFKRKGVPEQDAVQRAIGVIRDWAAGKGNVTAATQARAVKALAEWEALRTKARTTHDHSKETPMAIDLAVAAAPMAARMMPNAAAVTALAKKVEGWPPAKRDSMKKVIAARAKQLGMKPDGDRDYDGDVPSKAPGGMGYVKP